MKVLPSLLRKGKNPVFLKPRGDEKRGAPTRQDGSFPVFGSTAADPDSFIIKPRFDDDAHKRCQESSSDHIPSVINMTDFPPILPTISYPPLSNEPAPINLNSLQSHYQYENQLQADPFQGIKKYYANPPQHNRKYYGSERPAGSFDRYDETPLVEESPIGVEQFASLTKFQGLKRDVSLLGMRRSATHQSESRSYFDEDASQNSYGIAALEELTKSQEPDVYMDDEDTCDMEFSQEDGSEYDQVTIEDSTSDKSALNTGKCSVLKTGEESTSGNGSSQTSLEGTKYDDEDCTAFFSECSYDTKEEETHDLAAVYDVKKEIRVTKMPVGETLATIEETGSMSSYSQFDDEGSMTSSYVFSLVDDDKDVLKMKRRRKSRPNRKARRQQSGPLFSPSLMNGEPDNFQDDDRTSQTNKNQIQNNDADSFVGCSCSLSFDKVKEDMKSTYADATKAINQVLYAFFVVEEDVNAKANEIRGVKFKEQQRSRLAPEDKFSMNMLV
jgi:hypothetical protein